MSSSRRPFVVLHHTGVPSPHYDLLIDVAAEEALLTWRLPCWPPGEESLGVVLQAPHRRLYLTYEGPVSQGRGEVRRIAAGECELTRPARQVYEIYFDFGTYELIQAAGDEWTLSVLS